MKFHWYIWIPRIMIILISLFMALFSFDVFEEKAGFLNIILSLLIHNIPSLILLLILFVTWNHPLLGGIILLIGAIVFSIWIAVFFAKFLIADLLLFAIPMMIAAFFFFLAHYKRHPELKSTEKEVEISQTSDMNN